MRTNTKENAELVLQRETPHIVARAVRKDFWNQEQGDAARARGGALQPCENQMYDIGRAIMLAVGNEDFVARDVVTAVAIPSGAAAKIREIGTSLRFCQVHGSGPFAGYELG